MAQHIVDALVVTLGLDTSNYDKGKKKVEKDTDDLAKKSSKLEDSVLSLGKGFARFFASIKASTALLGMIEDVAKANDELNFLSHQLGMSTTQIKAFQNAASASGGSAQGMTNSMKSLNNAMTGFKTTGDASLMPTMNALGVSMVDAQGHIRRTDDLMLDLADSMHKMDAQQAYFLGEKLGLDDGTINTLIQGRDALKDMVNYQKTLYQASKQDLENSRQLQKNRAILNAQWDSMKTLMASGIIPVLNKLSLIAISFFEFLQRHQRTVKAVFETMAIVIGTLVVGNLTKALGVLLRFIAPFTPFIAVVTALAGAFVLLYDDYKTWAEGGNSLFKWDAFSGYIDTSTLSVNNLKDAFKGAWQELKENLMPTLKGYVEIINDVKNGDFKKAGRKALDMGKEYLGQVADTYDRLTGHQVGTARKINVINHNDQDFNTILQRQARLAGITDKREIDAFTATVAHESNDGKNLAEGTNYSYKGWQRLAPNQRNIRNWLGSHTQADFNKLTGEQKLNIMYANMNGNGANDGYKFRGRGGIQLTGRANYEAFAKSIGRMDIMGNPDMVATDKELAAQASVWYWKKHNIGKLARQGDLAGVRKAVNGGTIGMADVQQRYNALQQIGAPSASVSPQGSNTNNHVEVKVGDINVNTSASTVTGVSSDAMKGIGSHVTTLIPPMR